MKYWLAVIWVLCLSFTASAGIDIVGKIGGGAGLNFSGRYPLTGGIGAGTPPPVTCTGTIDTSEGCPLPMLGS